MAAMGEVLNRIHTDGKDPFETYGGHSKLATIDVYSYQDTAATDSIYTSKPLADDQNSLNEWLDSYPSVSRGESPLSGGLKLLVVHIEDHGNATSCLRARSMLRLAFDRLQLPATSLASFWGLSSDFIVFPKTVVSNGSSRQASCLIVSHWALSWSYNRAEKLCRGIILVERYRGYESVNPLEQTISELRDFVDQPCFLGFVASVVAITKVSPTIVEAFADVKKMQGRLKGWRTPVADALPGITDPSMASIDVMSLASRVLGYQDRLRVLQKLNSFLARQLSDFHATSANETEATRQRAVTLDDSLIHLEQKISSLSSVIQKIKVRATMQLAVLFNIIAQKDAKVSISIATASRALAVENKKEQRISIAIAKASRAIAVESKRDSSSMKTIAAVTMLFLPGTFIASLFATPIFQWSVTTGLRVDSQIWIYWATTIPLTLLTIGMWWVWLKVVKGCEQVQLHDAEDFDELSDLPSPFHEIKGQDIREDPSACKE